MRAQRLDVNALAVTGGDACSSARPLARRHVARPRVRTAIGALLLAGASSANPAQAQLASGYSGRDGIRFMGQEETYAAIRQLGDCFAQRRPRDAEALLATPPGSTQEGRAVRALLGNHTVCIENNSRMRAPRDVIRGAIADGMYRRLSLRAPAADTSERHGAIPATLVAFSRCVARRNPQEVHDLLLTTRLGTREEQAALVRIFPQLRECLPPTNNPRLAAPFVRLALADALYDRARRARPSPESAR